MRLAPWTLGEARISAVEELRIANKLAYFTQDEALLAAHRHWLAPYFLDDNGGFDLVFQSFVIEVDGRVVLLDPCTGNDKPHPVPFFDRLDVPWIERIVECGYRPGDIDVVVCTHLHHDHCGWNTMLRDGRWVPTFPKARYVFQRREYDYWKAADAGLAAVDFNAGVFERSVAPVVQAGLADLLTGPRSLSASLRVEAAPGHTPGHQILHLDSAGQRAIFAGDCYHHPIQLVEPAIMFGDVADAAALIATRRRLVELAASQSAALIAAHACAPYAVRVSRRAGELRFFAGL